MARYLVRSNINGRVFSQFLGPDEKRLISQIIAEGMLLQGVVNQRYLGDITKGRRAPCASIEVFKLLYKGIPARLKDRKQDG